MPLVDITLQGTTLNTSAQIGDIVYYASPAAVTGGFSSAAYGDIVTVGAINAIAFNGGTPQNQVVISVDIPDNVPNPGSGDFLFFSKDNKANSNGVLGYYALVKMENDSTTDAELFSVATEFFESSK